MRRAASLVLSLLLLSAPAAAADPILEGITAAQQAYQAGELLKAGASLQRALDTLHGRLAEAFVPLMPAAPAGWQAYDAQAEAMGIAGGGMTVMRGYEKGQASLNASIILDAEAVKGVADILANPAALAAQPGMSRVSLADGQALLRWDPQDKSGEVMLVVGDQMLLQVVGNALDKPDILSEMMRSWNIPAIRKQAGM